MKLYFGLHANILIDIIAENGSYLIYLRAQQQYYILLLYSIAPTTKVCMYFYVRLNWLNLTQCRKKGASKIMAITVKDWQQFNLLNI